jgi:hypothetical protein
MAARNLNLEPDMEFSAYQNAIFAFLASEEPPLRRRHPRED